MHLCPDVTVTWAFCGSSGAKALQVLVLIPVFRGSCTPVIIASQAYLYEPEELALQREEAARRELFIALLIGLSLAVSLSVTGITGTALVQTQHLASDS